MEENFFKKGAKYDCSNVKKTLQNAEFGLFNLNIFKMIILIFLIFDKINIKRLNMNYADKIYELRKAKNVSRETLRTSIGVKEKQVSRWEQGIEVPEFKYAKKLATYFGISVDELFGEEINIEEENKENLSFHFKNISIIYSLISLINYIGMILLGHFSNEIAKIIYSFSRSICDSEGGCSVGSFNSMVTNIKESICLFGIIWTIIFSFILLMSFIIFLFKYFKETKNKIIRTNLVSSFKTSIIVIFATLLGSVLILSVGQHVEYININTFGFFNGLLFLIGSLFAIDVFITLIKIILMKALKKVIIFKPWKGYKKGYEIAYVSMGLALFIFFIIFGSFSYIGFYMFSIFYFPISFTLLVIHLFLINLPLKSE